MRITIALPLAAAFALAACGNSASADANGDGKVSTDEAAAAAAKVDGPRPGKYKTSIDILDFTMPGVPQAMMASVRGSMTSSMDSTYCQSAADREDSIRQMTDNMGRGNCTYNKFDTSGNSFDVDMDCTSPQGAKGHYTIAGTTNSDGSDMTMEISQDVPGMGGRMHMKSHVVSTRIGDCDG